MYLERWRFVIRPAFKNVVVSRFTQATYLP